MLCSNTCGQDHQGKAPNGWGSATDACSEMGLEADNSAPPEDASHARSESLSASSTPLLLPAGETSKSSESLSAITMPLASL